MSEQVETNREQVAILSALSAVEELFNDATGSVVVRVYPEDEEGNELAPVDKEVRFKACKLKHLSPLTVMIQAMVSGLGDTEVLKVLDYVSGEQQRKLEEGVNPYALNTENMIREVILNGSVIAQFFSGAVQLLPHYASLLTNLTKEEIDNMDPMHATLVVYGIFARNYHFFTQNGPQLYRALMGSLGSRLLQLKKAKH